MTINYKWLKFFPHTAPRQQQTDAINFTLNEILNNNKKFVILELGTGCGKSAVGVTIANTLYDQQKLKSYESGAYILTTQKILQQQYVSDFKNKGLSEIKSASNYTCKRMKQNSCAQIRRSFIEGNNVSKNKLLQCRNDCSYKSKKNRFLQSKLGITNFSYFLAETQYVGELKERNVLIIDEAHNTEDQLSRFLDISISENFCSGILQINLPATLNQQSFYEFIRGLYFKKLKLYLDDYRKKIEELKLVSDVKGISKLIKQFEALDKHKCKISRFIVTYNSDNWVLDVSFDKNNMRRLSFKSIDISQFSEELLFSRAKHIILMSATIIDKDIFCESLGIDKSNVAFLSIPSPFPIENRPVLYHSVGSLNRENLDKNLPDLVKVVQQILDIHKGQKGIIHCHTYKIARFIKSQSNNKRLILHNSETRDKEIERYIRSKSDVVLLSPSSTEGLDLYGDRSRFQIICKLAYPYLGDKLVRLRKKRRDRWYEYETTKILIQSIGRSIRSKDDNAITYILDGSFGWFYRKNLDIFPSDFAEMLIK
jgi:Rad3-related DNA helicase